MADKKNGFVRKTFLTISLTIATYMIIFTLGFSSVFLEILRDISISLDFKVRSVMGLIETLTFADVQHMAFFIGLISILVFIKYPIRGKGEKKSLREKVPFYDWILCIAILIPFFYTFFVYDSLALRQGIVYPIDIVFGLIAIILTIEAARRILGLPLVLLTIGFLIYGVYNSNYDIKNFVGMMYLYNLGLWGTPVWVATFYIYFFMFFASVLKQIGLGEYFINAAISLAGSKKGGPAKVAVFSSAALGMMTGSSTGNVLTTGAFTIPLMKKTGYSAETAGAIESAASTGGQIMPPVLGSASFIMAVYLSMKYIDISIAAILPALLYFFGVYIFVDMEANKAGLEGLPSDKLPPKIEIIKKGYYILPIMVLIWVLARGFSPQYGAMSALGLAMLIEWITYKDNPNLHKVIFLTLVVGATIILLLLGFEWQNLPPFIAVIAVFLSIFYGFFVKKVKKMSQIVVSSMEDSISKSLGVVMACVMAGLIEGVLLYTGLTIRISSIFIKLSGGNLLILLILSMVIAIILGMGMPTPAVYVITVITLAPAIVKLGVPELAAHFFLFFFGILGPLTPPVAVTSYAAAALSGGDFWKTGIQAFRAAIVALIVPFAFVYRPELLIIPIETWDSISVLKLGFYFVMALIGVYFTVVALGNYLRGKLPAYERLIVFAGASFAILSIIINPWLSIIALFIVGFEIIASKKRASLLLIN
jgi:TRAP transporter 4TM/12TM fusion protein